MIHVSKHNLNVPFSERIIGHFGDNKTEQLFFEITEKTDNEFRAELLIEFSDGNVNSVILPKDSNNNNIFVWCVMAEDIFCSGLARIQIKITTDNGEVWHSPKAAVEFLHSIDEYNSVTELHPNIIVQINEKINEIYKIIENYLSYDELKNYVTHEEAAKLIENCITRDDTETLLRNYITRHEAEILVEESINDLLLPLDNRLDGV